MVTVHGEIPVAETPALQTFLASDDDRPLRDDPFWTRSYQDGRTSEAVLGLLRKLREARAARDFARMTSRRDVRLHIARGGKGYAVLPLQATSVARDRWSGLPSSRSAHRALRPRHGIAGPSG